MGTTLRRGDVIRHVMAGGGGWGDPLECDPDLVQEDVWNEKLTIAHGRREYAVVIEPESLAVDRAATERLRAPRRRDRGVSR